MDNHPIPQDVTGFQFRLIGDMTIKQFAYLAAGAILGWIMFSLPVFFLVKFPLGLFFAGGGAFLAFAPIGGRPADTMLFFFLKALFSPSQYIYQQSGTQLPTTPLQQKTFVKKEEHEEKNPSDGSEQEKKNEKVHFEAFPAALSQSVLQPSSHVEEKIPNSTQQPPISTQPPVSNHPVNINEAQKEMLTKEVQEVTQELSVAKEEEKVAEGTKQEEAHLKVEHLESDLQTIMQQKQALEQQLVALEKQLADKKQQVFTPTTAQEPPKETSHVRKIPVSMGASVGTPLTNDVPNLITGIVKDPRGNVLPNILIEVKDKDNNPVRAFKTNPLGQFASATPVLNGVYTITFEDPHDKQRFDAIEITANGEVMLPLEVISVDAREELRQELFGAQTTVLPTINSLPNSPAI